METLWYIAGLLTWPAILVVWALCEMTVEKNLELECLRCRRHFGELGETYNWLTRLEFKWHRKNGECLRNTNS